MDSPTVQNRSSLQHFYFGNSFFKSGVDVFGTHQLDDAMATQITSNCGVNPGKHYGFSLMQKTLQHGFKIVDAGGIDHGHIAHANKHHCGTVGNVVHQLFKLVGNTEKEGTGNFVNYASCGKFQVDHGGVVLLILRIGDQGFYLSDVGHTLHKQQGSQYHTDLNGYGKIYHHGEHKGGDEDQHVVARPFEYGCKGAPLTDRKSTRLNSSHVRISYAV